MPQREGKLPGNVAPLDFSGWLGSGLVISECPRHHLLTSGADPFRPSVLVDQAQERKKLSRSVMSWVQGLLCAHVVMQGEEKEWTENSVFPLLGREDVNLWLQGCSHLPGEQPCSLSLPGLTSTRMS